MDELTPDKEKDFKNINNMKALFELPFFMEPSNLIFDTWTDKSTELLFPQLQHLFGNTLHMKIQRKITTVKNNARIFGTVLTPLNRYGFENPLIPGTLWEVSVPIPKNKVNNYQQGDIISFQYKHMTRPEKQEHYSQLIQPIAETVESIPLQIDQPYGPAYAAALAEKVGVLDSEFFDGLFKVFQSNFHKDLKVLQKKHKKEKELLDETIRRLDEAKEQKEKIEEQINLLRNELTNERGNFENSLKEINNELEQVHSEHQSQLKEEKNKFINAFYKLQLVPPYLELNDFSNENKLSISLNEFPDMIDTLRGMLYISQELSYEKHIIDRFITGIKTNQLVLLSGPSGTGKSSLIRGLSKVVKNVKSKIIRVQSSWTDKQDLLGFYNPIERRFIATPFLDALADARQNEDNLYLVCLDEMNLSHIEYYFAELLSAREDDVPVIDLYSIRDYETALKVLEQAESGIYNSIELQNAADLVHRYPSRFELPNNVRFIGTMNMDETVKPISPKVIDRSFVIELRHPENSSKLEEELQSLVKDQEITDQMILEIDLDKDIYQPLRSYDNEESNSLLEVIKDINPILEQLNAQLNKRAIRHIETYLLFINDQKEALNHIILSKILPRIRFSKGNSVQQEAFEAFCDEIQKITNDANITLKIKEMQRSQRLVNYWS
jgi:energy-coupling factor transporter ATP-binding protein EcfA2